MYKNYIKRIIDLLLAAIGFLIISPVFLLLWLLLAVANKGAGAFFTQPRPGKNERIFRVIKFKTMTDERDAEGNLLPDAERLTKIGKLVRSTSLDEIPQLLNVLKNEMSIVGPRPERPFFVEKLSMEIPYYYKRLSVKPGITGWAQIKHKYDSSLDDVKEKLKFDFYYIENMSLKLDFKIMVNTFLVIIFMKGH